MDFHVIIQYEGGPYRAYVRGLDELVVTRPSIDEAYDAIADEIDAHLTRVRESGVILDDATANITTELRLSPRRRPYPR
jgi:predicted RNase H-like HicB family nuclease